MESKCCLLLYMIFLVLACAVVCEILDGNAISLVLKELTFKADIERFRERNGSVIPRN